MNTGSSSRILGPLMMAPAGLLLVLTIIFPLGYSLVFSAYSWKLTELNAPKTFVFLENYQEILTDEVFWKATMNTLVFVLGTVGVELVLGFFIALMLTEIVRGRKLINAFILLPMIISPVVVALIWRYLYDPQFGLINFAFRSVGYTETIAWLGDESLALLSIMIVDIWQNTPFVILVLHAGMLTVPGDIIEAARVEGARYTQIVYYIMVPYLMPLTLLILLLRTMDTYRVFDTVYTLTRGGPGLATEVVGLYTYRTGFTYFRMGYAMALAIVTLLIILVISLAYIRLIRTRQV